MTVHLPEGVERSILDAVHRGQFTSSDEAIAAAWRAFQHRQVQSPATEPTAGPGGPAPAYRPIWEIADEIRASVPEGEWAKLPVDGASQFDHYLYGSPKRPTP